MDLIRPSAAAAYTAQCSIVSILYGGQTGHDRSQIGPKGPDRSWTGPAGHKHSHQAQSELAVNGY